MGDANHSTKLGRFLGSLPLGASLKAKISAGDYILDKVVGLVDKSGNKVETSEVLAQLPETPSAKQTVIQAVLGGGDFLLDQHDIDGLTEEENEIADQIAHLSLKLALSVGLRKLKL